MHPVLFETETWFGHWTVYSYGVLLAVAYISALLLAVSRARRAGVDASRVMDLGVYLIIAALVGAKLMLVLVDVRYFAAKPDALLSVAVLRAAGVFYGGLLAAFFVALWLVRRYSLPLWTTADLFAPGIALGHVIGRLGCLLAGCCFGRRTTVPWAITFTDPAAAANVGTPLNIPLHPTQLYDAGAELLILIVLLLAERRGCTFPGRTFWTYILLYAASRFVIEFYRGDDRGYLMGLSTSQLVSLVAVPAAILLLIRLRRSVSPELRPGHAVQ